MGNVFARRRPPYPGQFNPKSDLHGGFFRAHFRYLRQRGANAHQSSRDMEIALNHWINTLDAVQDDLDAANKELLSALNIRHQRSSSDEEDTGDTEEEAALVEVMDRNDRIRHSLRDMVKLS